MAKRFTDEEQAAMRERAAEVKRAKRGGRREDGERDLLEKIASMPEGDRQMAERIHAVVTETAPELWPRTWYGSPAYAREGKVILFFQNAAKFNTRYGTLGFSDSAALDDGEIWPTSYAVREVTPAVEARIAELVRRAGGG